MEQSENKNSHKRQVWLVTGVSSGLGKAIAEAAIAAGHHVVGTVRKPEQAAAFNDSYSAQQSVAVTADLTNEQDIYRVITTVRERFGRLDILVNNAGVGFVGAVEEASMEEIRTVFEVNVFGTILLTKAALPLFRAQKSGHIVQISSHGGIKAFAGFGVYNASKFALEGFSEALAAEIQPLGIRLTIVEPGPFRTNFAGTSLTEAAQTLDDYAASAGAFRKRMKDVVHGNQEGDPAKAAAAILHIVGLPNDPPLRLPLGKIALQTITAKLNSVQQDIDKWRELAESAIF